MFFFLLYSGVTRLDPEFISWKGLGQSALVVPKGGQYYSDGIDSFKIKKEKRKWQK